MIFIDPEQRGYSIVQVMTSPSLSTSHIVIPSHSIPLPPPPLPFLMAKFENPAIDASHLCPSHPSPHSLSTSFTAPPPYSLSPSTSLFTHLFTRTLTHYPHPPSHSLSPHSLPPPPLTLFTHSLTHSFSATRPLHLHRLSFSVRLIHAVIFCTTSRLPC